MSYEPHFCKNISYSLWKKTLLFNICNSAIFLLFSKMHYKELYLNEQVAILGPLSDHHHHTRRPFQILFKKPLQNPLDSFSMI